MEEEEEEREEGDSSKGRGAKEQRCARKTVKSRAKRGWWRGVSGEGGRMEAKRRGCERGRRRDCS